MDGTETRRCSGLLAHRGVLLSRWQRGGVAGPRSIRNDSDLATTGRCKMSDANRLLFLRIALIVIGLTFIFGIYTLGVLWPSGWTWGQGHSHYLMMIIGVYGRWACFCSSPQEIPTLTRALFGSPCGRAWFTRRSWAFRPSATRPNAVISWEMCQRLFSWRSYLQR